MKRLWRVRVLQLERWLFDFGGPEGEHLLALSLALDQVGEEVHTSLGDVVGWENSTILLFFCLAQSVAFNL